MKISTALSVIMPKSDVCAKTIGHAWYASIKQDIILKAELWKGDYTGYAGLKLTAIHNQHGPIDTIIIPFPAYTTPHDYSVPKMLTSHAKHMYHVEWNNVLTMEELRDIRAQVNEYIDLLNGGKV